MASTPAEPATTPSVTTHPALTVSAVARRLGIAPATLRTWDRRYALGPTSHAAGSHRRYTQADVRRLELMRRLTLEGVAPADAARIALATDPVPDLPAARGPADQPPTGRRERDRLGPIPTPRASVGRIVAQHGLPVPDGAVTVRGLARAAMALDPVAVSEILELSVQRRGTVATWDTLLSPFLVTMGERVMATGEGIEVEHLVSHYAASVFARVAANLKQNGQTRPVILACVAGEQHTLPLSAVAAALAERRVPTRMLGALPAVSLGTAMRRCGPAVVFLWAQLTRVGTPAYLDALPSVRPTPIFVLGGPGWDMAGRRLPNNIQRVRCLLEAVERVVAVAGT